jgi:predicted RNA-binding protein (virulence factor B family)
MIKIGKTNNLKVVKKVDFGLYLDGGESGEILLPKRYVDESMEVGDELDVFIYCDSEDRLVATTEKPLIEVGEFGLLKAVEVNRVGAFMEWGLQKDLLVPFREQSQEIRVGGSYVVYAFLDNATKRIVGSTKLNKYVGNRIPRYSEGDTVDILAVHKTDLGYKVIVDNLFWGMIYNNDLFDPLSPGDRIPAYVKTVREDGKIDVTLRERGGERVFQLANRIMGYLREAGGGMTLSDSSSPDEIKAVFQCSKKDFKKALGYLYKKGKILIADGGVTLSPSDSRKK